MDERAQAISGHEPPPTPPIRLGAGEMVFVGERHKTWSAFVYVESDQGGGWVPAYHLASESGFVEVTTPYDSQELKTRGGDELTVITRDDVTGWSWCRSDEGRQGWVPNENLSPLPPEEE